MFYCGINSYNECCFFNKYISLESDYLIIIEGTQRSGKTTLAKYISEEFGIAYMRGYPKSNELLNIKHQFEACYQSKEIIQESVLNLSTGIVFDRSPISSIA